MVGDATVTTVGYGDIGPQTDGGRVGRCWSLRMSGSAPASMTNTLDGIAAGGAHDLALLVVRRWARELLRWWIRAPQGAVDGMGWRDRPGPHTRNLADGRRSELDARDEGDSTMSGRLQGRRVLVTTADLYIGPPVVELFEREGAEVIADTSDYTEEGAVERVVEDAGRIDVLVANFAGPRRMMPLGPSMLTEIADVPDEDFRDYLDVLVWPMLRFVRAVVPQMVERRSGRICGVTSASTMRSIAGLSAYIAARSAQNGLLRVVGAEVAPHGVRVNAIAPAWIENNAYFGGGMLDDPGTRAQMDAMTPAGTLGRGADAAELVLALASEAGDYLVGQVIPVDGGWSQS